MAKHNLSQIKKPETGKTTRKGNLPRCGLCGYSCSSEDYLCEQCSRKKFGEIPDFTL